jgi:hypothetical protein
MIAIVILSATRLLNILNDLTTLHVCRRAWPAPVITFAQNYLMKTAEK